MLVNKQMPVSCSFVSTHRQTLESYELSLLETRVFLFNYKLMLLIACAHIPMAIYKVL